LAVTPKKGLDDLEGEQLQVKVAEITFRASLGHASKNPLGKNRTPKMRLLQHL